MYNRWEGFCESVLGEGRACAQIRKEEHDMFKEIKSHNTTRDSVWGRRDWRGVVKQAAPERS